MQIDELLNNSVPLLDKSRRLTTRYPTNELTVHVAYLNRTLIGWLTVPLSVMLIIAAIAFVWAEAEGQTDISIFGTAHSYTTISALAIFCVFAIAALNLRRMLTSVCGVGPLGW